MTSEPTEMVVLSDLAGNADLRARATMEQAPVPAERKAEIAAPLAGSDVSGFTVPGNPQNLINFSDRPLPPAVSGNGPYPALPFGLGGLPFRPDPRNV
jgi:hypothetical protein